MPFNLYSNNGHNKVGGHISKNVAKIANNWFKISRAATFGQSLGGNNLAITWPILTFDHTKMINSLRRVQWWKDLSSFRSDFGFLSHFLPGWWYLPCLSPQTHRSKSMSQKIGHHIHGASENFKFLAQVKHVFGMSAEEPREGKVREMGIEIQFYTLTL